MANCKEKLTLQGFHGTNITSFPWTTNEKEVYICFTDEKLKF